MRFPLMVLFAAVLIIPTNISASNAPVSPNGIALYQDYRSWQVLSSG